MKDPYYVWMGINIYDSRVGAIYFELFPDCPITSENFKCLCTGEKGMGKNGFKLWYKGC